MFSTSLMLVEVKGHVHNVSAYSRRSVNAWVVEYRVHILSRAVNFSLLAGPNPSEQKPNQTKTG